MIAGRITMQEKYRDYILYYFGIIGIKKFEEVSECLC